MTDPHESVLDPSHLQVPPTSAIALREPVARDAAGTLASFSPATRVLSASQVELQ